MDLHNLAPWPQHPQLLLLQSLLPTTVQDQLEKSDYTAVKDTPCSVTR